MSEQAMREAIVRMASDPRFRAAVHDQNDPSLSELGLTAEELETLRSLSVEETDAGAEQLGRRLSKSSIFFGGTLSALHQSSVPDHVANEQQHLTMPTSPLSEGHDRSEPDLPQHDGPELPQHGGQGSGHGSPFRTGGAKGGELPTGQSGDDVPGVDVNVHHDDHQFHSDGRAGYNPQTDGPDNNPGNKGDAQYTVTTRTNPDGSVTQHESEPNGRDTYTVYRTDGTTSTEVDHPDGSYSQSTSSRDGSTTVHNYTWDGQPKDTTYIGPSSPHSDGGPDDGTESSGPAVDPAWASKQHGAPTGDPEKGQEHAGPVLDPTAASKVGTGGSGTGGEGGTEAGPNPILKPGEASTEHISDNPTGYGSASYGKVDPNPVEH